MTKRRPPPAIHRPLLEDARAAVSYFEGVHYPEKPLLLEEVVSEDTPSAPKRWVVKGEFGRVDRATENKRRYPRELMEEEVARLQDGIAKRKVFGELDHPQDGRTSLNRVSHVITRLEVQPDGILYGEAEILPTERGRNFKAIVESGCQVGFSTRGFGATMTNAQGESVVQKGFKLVTVDAVADPADRDAWPEAFQEGKGNLQMDEIENLTEDQLKTQRPELFEAIKAQAARELQEQLAEKDAQISHLEEAAEKRVVQAETKARKEGRETALSEATEKTLETIANAKAQMEDQIRGEYLSDPKVAGALTAIESVKAAIRPFVLAEDAEGVVAEKEARIEALETQLARERTEHQRVVAELTLKSEKMATLAKKAGYSYRLESLLRNNPDADLIRSLVGDVGAYATVAEMEAKVGDVVEELTRRAEEKRQQEAAREEELEKVRSTSSAEVEELRQKITVMEQALAKSLALNKRQSLDQYVAERLRNHPRKKELIEAFQATEVVTRAQADAVFEKYRAPLREANEIEAIRARIRQRVGASGSVGGTDYPDFPLSEEALPEDPVEDLLEGGPSSSGLGLNGTGLSTTEFKQLSGI